MLTRLRIHALALLSALLCTSVGSPVWAYMNVLYEEHFLWTEPMRVIIGDSSNIYLVRSGTPGGGGGLDHGTANPDGSIGWVDTAGIFPLEQVEDSSAYEGQVTGTVLHNGKIIISTSNGITNTNLKSDGTLDKESLTALPVEEGVYVSALASNGSNIIYAGSIEKLDANLVTYHEPVLRILSMGESPAVVGSTVPDTWVSALAARGNYVYIGLWDRSYPESIDPYAFQAYDISNPSSPVLQFSDNGIRVSGITFSQDGSRLFLLCLDNQTPAGHLTLRSYMLTGTPHAPQFILRIDIPHDNGGINAIWASAITAYGSYVFFGNSDAMLEAYDFTDMQSPVLCDQVNLASSDQGMEEIKHIAVDSVTKRAYVAWSPDGFSIVDLAHIGEEEPDDNPGGDPNDDPNGNQDDDNTSDGSSGGCTLGNDNATLGAEWLVLLAIATVGRLRRTR